MIKNNQMHSPYALALLKCELRLQLLTFSRHEDTRAELKTPKKELTQQREIAQVKERFTAMCELTDMCTVRPDVSFYRKKFALRYFFKTAVPYGFFLMALLIGITVALCGFSHNA